MITHSIPGRIRVRHAAPLTEDALNTLTSDIRKLAPSARVEHNPETCGTLIVFDEKDASPAVVELCGGREDTAAPAGGCPMQQLKIPWPSMRVVKRGMSASLLASMGLLALNREGAHALFGSVFLACLARHAWVYRRRLIQ